MQLIYSFTVALFLTIALIPVLIRFSARLGLVDAPSCDRKIHTQPIPRSGGLAIVLGVFLPLLFLLPIEGAFRGLLWGAVVIVVFGYLDDRYELSYQWKFFGQIFAVIAAMMGGIGIFRVPLMGLDPASLWFSSPLTFLFLLGAINAVNLTDGLDGLAAGTSLLSLSLITIFALLQDANATALVSLTLIGGLVGFLRYNTFPARIFMGDTGSQFLGYTVACLAIIVSQAETAVISPVMPLLLLGLPILDTMTVMAIRIKEGRSPFSPDKNHLHHQLMSLGLKHHQSVAVIYVIQVILMVSAYLLRYENDLLLLGFYAVFALSIVSFLYVAHRKRYSAIQRMEDIPARDRRNPYLRKMEWLYQNSAIIIEWAMAALLIVVALNVENARKDFCLVALVLGVFLMLVAVVFHQFYGTVARLSCYSASVFVVYLYTKSLGPELSFTMIDGAFVALVAFLMLAIRMTRRVEFRLDTQDLLVLLFVLIVPQLPFETLDDNAIGQVSLRLAALMYSCEFVLGRNKTRLRVLNIASLASLFVVGLLPVL